MKWLTLLAPVLYIILQVGEQLDVVFKSELRANWGAMSHRILLKLQAMRNELR